MMLRVTHETAALVRRLLASGWPQRHIARQLQLSHTTVSRIATGKWAPEQVTEDDPDAILRARAKRCPGCGGRVYHWPCLCCQLRAA